VHTLYCLEKVRGEQRISPPENNFTPKEELHPQGITSPPGKNNFTPRE
jgi:hypothetical protein